MPDHTAQHEREREFDVVLRELQQIHQTQHELLRAVEHLHNQGVHLMAISEDLKAAMAKVDAATTALGTRFQALADRLKNDPTDEEVAAVATELSADADRLNAIGADATNPVPVPVPPVTP